jgi:predicted GNAT family N-acyltransferase
MSADLTARLATDAEVEGSLALRERVFCGEQGVALEAERDGLDAEALHVVVADGGRVVGTCRLLIEGGTARLGRMAVDVRRRRRGVGTALLREAEAVAARRGARRVTLHAQLTAMRLYARNGYTPSGPPFMEEGIEHVAMEKGLA